TGRPPSCECGECTKRRKAAYMREWYQSKSPDERRAWISRRDPELSRQRDRERYERDKEKRTALINSRAEHKRKAVSMVNIRRARGTIVLPEACEDCGEKGIELTGHHEGYSKPLDVVWLCRACHGAR